MNGGRVVVLALIALAPVACERAIACPQTRVAEGAAGSPHVAKPLAAPKFDWPVHGRIFIECWTEDKETIAIAARSGATVRAAQPGLIVFAGELRGYGKLVAIRHAGGIVSATYGDLGDLRVKANDSVEKGQPIGAVRSAKDFPGDGLRFELRRGAKAIDPRPLMSAVEPPREDGGDFVSR
jgi:septal ring factor EnvC (AmiA/AmiB activator)